MSVRVIGIDPAASSKGSYLCDGKKIWKASSSELAMLLKQWHDSADRYLLCWDSPLTVPSTTVKDHNDLVPGCFSTRKIEASYLMERGEGAKKKDGTRSPPLIAGTKDEKGRQILPSGIFVGHYTGVPHWAISQYMLGYPNVGGKMGVSRNDYKLISEQPHNNQLLQDSVVEVHPALSAYLWVKDSEDGKKVKSWRYKTNKKVQDDQIRNLTPSGFYSLLRKELKEKTNIQLPLCLSEWRKDKKSIQDRKITDDEFDAFVAWLLGRIWLDSNNVELAGNAATGSWLIPTSSKTEP
ncbi:hypothetical protein [Neolewinella persica]|uniref:hypothetical protein n=1 Tax=Neolewinella persica TaxID=70998 RepID=UPI0003A217F0|nr:hypothetical protein [Neolewinella persica]